MSPVTLKNHPSSSAAISHPQLSLVNLNYQLSSSPTHYSPFSNATCYPHVHLSLLSLSAGFSQARRSALRTALPSQNRDPVGNDSPGDPGPLTEADDSVACRSKMREPLVPRCPGSGAKAVKLVLKPLPGLSRKPGGSLISMMSKWFLSLKGC